MYNDNICKKRENKGENGLLSPTYAPGPRLRRSPASAFAGQAEKEAVSRNSAAAGVPGSESGYSFATAGPYAVPGDTGAVGILLKKPVGPVF